MRSVSALSTGAGLITSVLLMSPSSTDGEVVKKRGHLSSAHSRIRFPPYLAQSFVTPYAILSPTSCIRFRDPPRVCHHSFSLVYISGFSFSYSDFQSIDVNYFQFPDYLVQVRNEGIL